MSQPSAGILYSGGKDSTLAASLLDRFYDVTLLTCHFGITDAWQHAATTADTLGYSFQTIELEQAVAEKAVTQMIEDGYPRNGIQTVHEHALEVAADRPFDAIADGTRRDDRVPTVSRPLAQSIEDRYDIDYVAPLAGFGASAVRQLADRTLSVRTGPSEVIPRADYEAELRALLRERQSAQAIAEIFPDHEQTIVVDRH